jgi:hypothetical protein
MAVRNPGRRARRDEAPKNILSVTYFPQLNPPYLLKFPEPPKIVPPAGDTDGGHFFLIPYNMCIRGKW